MVAATIRPAAIRQAVDKPHLPRLVNGDHLTRAEFERRYAAMADVKKAELIEGMVIMPSPVSNAHSQANSLVVWWLVGYSMATPGVEAGENATVRLDLDNEVQPDAHLRLLESARGASHVGAAGYIDGAPELIVEIAISSASYDYHVKRRIYRRNGVREYVIWRVEDGAIEWFTLENGDYLALAADTAGVIRSRVFPGLWLAADALLAGDLAAVLAALQAGLASPEHADFVVRLSAGNPTSLSQTAADG